ncbi:hypothetical protein CLOACE_00100 [Clostridium acetireducens DSM 10703]|jgi:uncharacterized protein (TIGR00255 family)|uniref:YicC family protein n=1 Tax=Clostridium acetireducens DSM 10703 TaxID=1121290 RepID=A0A1E8F1Y2_9CLOT|nr:YicC/YloC family endoribonuclease [Clostridium acetireducens]OFI07662.1 hypothetical protein CLOACE_00100 [Clostridium acetireducens DSM 10703]
MIKSMTGFGRGSFEKCGKNFVVEIKSVNHRYIDLNVRMPKTLMELEDKIRNLIKGKIHRGKVDVFISQTNYKDENLKVNINEGLLKNYLECLKRIRDEYNVKDDISVSLVAKFPDVINVEHEEQDMDEIWSVLSKSIEEALNSLLEMRIKEGEKLKVNINEKCDFIRKLVCKMEEHSPLVVKNYKEKLKSRIEELLQGSCVVDESRLAMEVAIFSDKACIDEEIVRLNSHIDQMKDTINMNEPVGRKLDFIIQEMNRETNTIASKANDLKIENLVLEIKNQVEKIREQIQNIE